MYEKENGVDAQHRVSREAQHVQRNALAPSLAKNPVRRSRPTASSASTKNTTVAVAMC